MGLHAGVLLDLQGPKIRLGTFENGGCVLQTGSEFRITTEQVVGTCDRASTTYKDFVKDVKPGNQVLLADGSLELRVISKTATDAITEVVSGGPIIRPQGNQPSGRGRQCAVDEQERHGRSAIRIGSGHRLRRAIVRSQARRRTEAAVVSGRGRFACADRRQD